MQPKLKRVTLENVLSNRNYFRQAPALVNGNYSLSGAESSLFYALLTEIDMNDKDFKDYTFTKKQLEQKLGISTNTTQLRATAKSLMRKVFEIVHDKDDWELMGFSYFSYKEGVFTCRFDKAMKPYLLELKQYALADIRQILQIKSEYSKRIYLMLKDRRKHGERKLNIEELYAQLEVPKSYHRYADFKRKVLLQSVKDINKYTDLEIKNIGTIKKPKYFEEHKPSRKVEAVTFYFKKNQNDLKAFIEIIREVYANQALYESKNGRMLKCSDKGLLYYADSALEWLDKDAALKEWEWLHEHREKLYCFQTNLLDMMESS
ncbi:MAG TPA: RepB family plasmid replication initiator protein [Sulfurospirillum arcachonense]|nr:RepB family plasmid replication initiator protein [Sulfurospirillum arcachonense]